MGMHPSKFDVGDTVHAIKNEHAMTWVPCSFCGSTGGIVGASGKRRNCPECYGRAGSEEWLPKEWRAREPMTVGQVRLEIEARKTDERYMLRETGVGTGTLWSAEDLFATEDEAKAACADRNGVLALASTSLGGPA